jgi:hypothetical protein
LVVDFNVKKMNPGALTGVGLFIWFASSDGRLAAAASRDADRRSANALTRAGSRRLAISGRDLLAAVGIAQSASRDSFVERSVVV